MSACLMKSQRSHSSVVEHLLMVRSEIELCHSVCTWCNGLSDQSLMMDPLNYFIFQPVLHTWCNKCHGMCYPV